MEKIHQHILREVQEVANLFQLLFHDIQALHTHT
jgi:hypothetical protein